jgi:hypothetical protein
LFEGQQLAKITSFGEGLRRDFVGSRERFGVLPGEGKGSPGPDRSTRDVNEGLRKGVVPMPESFVDPPTSFGASAEDFCSPKVVGEGSPTNFVLRAKDFVLRKFSFAVRSDDFELRAKDFRTSFSAGEASAVAEWDRRRCWNVS